MSQDNLEILRRAYAALGRGDVAAVLQICDPDIECQLPEGGISTGAVRGHQALREFMEGYGEAFESFRFEPEQFFEAGDQVVVFLRMLGRGRESGLEIELRPAHVWAMQGGRAVRIEVFPERERETALEAAGLRE